MKKNILAALRFPSHKKAAVEITNWQKFIASFRSCLQQKGHEENIQEDLWLFSFTGISSAYATVFGCLGKNKKQFDWKSSYGAVPVQIVFHLGSSISYQDRSSDMWNFLEHETLYVTDALKNEWYKFHDNNGLPSHTFKKSGNEFFQVNFTKKTVSRSEHLFPYRGEAIQGNYPECFYCGMKTHTPATCPSKMLSPAMKGVAELGYLSPPDIAENYRNVFSNIDRYIALFEEGVDPASIRKDPAMVVFLAYFDLFRVYQPRFLENMAFSSRTKWHNFDSVKLTPGSRKMKIGMDCLRVGKHKKAWEMFEEEIKQPLKQSYYAIIGQAFIALETGSVENMWKYLNKAEYLAEEEKEKVYIALLFARYYYLLGDLKNAGNTLSGFSTKTYNCPETHYANIQTEVTGGATDSTISQLRFLIEDIPEFFMLALIDPKLVPVQDMLEEILTEIITVSEQTAGENLKGVQEKYADLQDWINIEDEKLQLNLQTLQNLEEKFSRKSYFDYLDIIAASKGLLLAAEQIQNKYLGDLNYKISVFTKRYKHLRNYWEGYNYKSFFGEFKNVLDRIKEKLIRTTGLVNNGQSRDYREAFDILKVIENDLITNKRLLGKMELVETTLYGLGYFAKKFLVIEAVFIIAAILLLVLSKIILPAVFPDSSFGLLNSPRAVKMVLVFTSLIVAPMIAFLVTLLKMHHR